MPERKITHSYRDPLSEVWLSAAYKIGLRVERSPDAFAHSNGSGVLFIATDDDLDPDDCLAQMIFHELCHSLVEGPDSFSLPDWGLDNSSHEHDYREQATLRVQALLADKFGLRRILAPTTDFRTFYDSLELDPLIPRNTSSSQLAMMAIRRSETNPWWPHLGRALEATRAIVEVAEKWPAPGKAPSLYRELHDKIFDHPSGLPGQRSTLAVQCGNCAWRDNEGMCQQANQFVDANLRGCQRHEASFDCQDCGACCRSAYHSVTISDGDSIADKHATLLVFHENYTELRREEDHCAALECTQDRYSCTIYEDRPTCCREFENAGPNCVIARRRLGLSL